MRSAVLALVLLVTTANAFGAPWSFDLPPGYTEVPGAADEAIAPLQLRQGAVSLDVQVYDSASGGVRLTRITYVHELRQTLTRGALLATDDALKKSLVKPGTKYHSDAHHFERDQLAVDTVVDLDDMRVRNRRLYSGDSSGKLHLFWVVCAGPAEALATCEKAQQSMVLDLPDAVPIAERLAAEADAPAYLIGQIVAGVLVAMLVVWLFARRRR